MRLLKILMLSCLLLLGYFTNTSGATSYICKGLVEDVLEVLPAKCFFCESPADYVYDDLSSDKNLKTSSYSTCASELGLIEKPISQTVFDNLRARRHLELSNLLKEIIRSLSFREDGLVQDRSKIYSSSINHKALPSCQYYIFALRRILI